MVLSLPMSINRCHQHHKVPRFMCVDHANKLPWLERILSTRIITKIEVWIQPWNCTAQRCDNQSEDKTRSPECFEFRLGHPSSVLLGAISHYPQGTFRHQSGFHEVGTEIRTIHFVEVVLDTLCHACSSLRPCSIATLIWTPSFTDTHSFLAVPFVIRFFKLCQSYDKLVKAYRSWYSLSSNNTLARNISHTNWRLRYTTDSRSKRAR